jgi:hypothetical protein
MKKPVLINPVRFCQVKINHCSTLLVEIFQLSSFKIN